MMTMRSSSASFSFSCRNLWNSARLVCARMVSSRWMSGKRDTLTFFSCVMREQQVEELALDLEDLDHLEHAAAGGVHRAGPGPGARVALVADLRDLGEIHRADQVGDVRGGRIVRRVGADADARRPPRGRCARPARARSRRRTRARRNRAPRATARPGCPRHSARGTRRAGSRERGSAGSRAAASP